MIAGTAVAQHGALRCHVRRVPKGDPRRLQPFHLSFLLADSLVCCQDAQQGALRYAVQDSVSLQFPDFLVKPPHIRLHVVSRVLPRPDADRALVDGGLAAVDALLPFGKDDEHHLGL